MKIGEASNRSGLPTKTVRYYDEINLVTPVSIGRNGYREYEETDVRKLLFIRKARSFGFSIEECRGLLGLYEDRNRASGDVKRIAQERIVEIDKKLEELQSLRHELGHLVHACNGDDRPDCPILNELSNPA